MVENQPRGRTAAVPLSVTILHGIFSILAVWAMAGAVLTAFQGGTAEKALVSALLSVIATTILSITFTGRWNTPQKAVQDFLVVALLAFSVESRMTVWQAPASWGDLLHVTGFASSLVIILYFLLVIFFLTARGHREPLRCAVAVLSLPLLFNWLLLLQAPVLLQQTGLALSIGFRKAPEGLQTLGRAGVLIVFNQAVAALVCLLVSGRLIRTLSVHGLLVGSGLWCSLTPLIADWGSLPAVAALPPLMSLITVIIAAMTSQAGLWAEVYLLTGILLDGLHEKKPAWYWDRQHFRSGCVKGAIYSGLFMGIIHTGSALFHQYHVRLFLTAHPALASGIAGACLFPLVKTIIESFDVSAPFFGRLRDAYRSGTPFIRGLVIGIGLGAAVDGGLLGGESVLRFGWGFLVGGLAYGGVDLGRDLIESAFGRGRQSLQVWKIYIFGAVLGGAVGGLLAWYFDTAQIAVVAGKLQRFAAVSYPASGIEVKDYVTYPLFNKWGSVSIGAVTGGVRLLYGDAVSGVVNWAFAAPLFSINLVVLTAVLKRSIAPIRALFSRSGIIGIVEQTVRVLRWGLWMSPVINLFLKISADPSWYNQDGAIRTVAATVKSVTLGPEAFRSWSLQTFTALLAYDWFRIMIWVDHMGLRVATLVNLSFVGGDVVDEKSARALGYSARTRWMPEGIRRFTTWAPLLIPFYIPRGQEWDIAWTGHEALRSGLESTALPPGAFLFGALLLGAAAAFLFAASRHTTRERRVLANTSLPGASESMQGLSVLPREQTFVLTNGTYTATISSDGKGASRVFSAVRHGEELMLTRDPADPLWMCGKFLYFLDRERPTGDPCQVWSLTVNPVGRVGSDYAMTRVDALSVRIAHTWNDIYTEAILSVAEEDPVEVWQVVVRNLESRPRTLELTSYRELVLNVQGAFWRHPVFNNLHVNTRFVRSLNAIIARNNLLKERQAGFGHPRRSREAAFHAVREEGDAVELIGYEDYRAAMLGQHTLQMPDGLFRTLRSPEDEGLLYSFSPVACLRLQVQLASQGETAVRFVDGYGRDDEQVERLIRRHLGEFKVQDSKFKISGIAKSEQTVIPAKAGIQDSGEHPKSLNIKFHGEKTSCGAAMTRNSSIRQPHYTPPPADVQEMFSFSDDGAELQMGWETPRPWAHLMANASGYGVIAANDGDVYSFAGNAQQNGLTPFHFGSVPVQTPGQMLYLYNTATGEVETPTYAPLRHADAQHSITFGRGYVTFKKIRGSLEMEYSLAVLPDQPAEVRLLTVRNKGRDAVSYRVVPYFQIMLGEEPFDTQFKVSDRTDRDLQAVFFTNRDNDFHKGWAFAAISEPLQACETIRKRFIGGLGRDFSRPFMVEHGTSDVGQPDDGYRAACLSTTITVPAGGQETLAIIVGQIDEFHRAETLIRSLQQVPAAQAAFDRTKAWWADLLSVLHIETSNPALDRMVNHWLPYQVLASHLWGRTGLCQRSGAYGFRDQLQDILPLMYIDPELCRRQLVLHAGQQFLAGDVLQWWHQSWEGKTGMGMRGRASDPHLWLPYLVAHYVQATGDDSVLDEVVPFLESRRIPDRAEGLFFAQRHSRDAAPVFEHCQRAIDFSLQRLGPNGLPLMGSGDWNDGYNMLGRKGRGESVWLGFFLYEILIRFSHLAEQRNEAAAARLCDRAEHLKESLELMWREDHYLRGITDDGREFDIADSLTASWPIISGAAPFERGAVALATGLRHLEKDSLILLCYPSFDDDSDPYPGRIADYPPGVRENGGQYSHGASWMVDGLIRLAEMAAAKGDAAGANEYWKKAVEVWMKISPLQHLGPDSISRYGLSPQQQAADIYYGRGYEGRGGWSWYTGAAARMLYNAYQLLGLRLENGSLHLADHAFQPKGDLQLKKVVYRGKDVHR